MGYRLVVLAGLCLAGAISKKVHPYGTSKCIAPKQSKVFNGILHRCYQESGARQAWFEQHEWTNHGVCAGGQSSDEFFDQVCALSKKPLDFMNKVRDEHFNPCLKQTKEPDQEACFLRIIEEMERTFAVYSVDQYNDQIMLSACAGSDGQWKLAKVVDFPKVCGKSSSSSGTTPSPHPSSRRRGHKAGAKVCAPMKPGPKCYSDSQCAGKSGCLRCAKSGKCTDQPLSRLRLVEEPPAGAELPSQGAGKVVAEATPTTFVATAALVGGLVLLTLRSRRQTRSQRLAGEEIPGEQYMSVE